VSAEASEENRGQLMKNSFCSLLAIAGENQDLRKKIINWIEENVVEISSTSVISERALDRAVDKQEIISYEHDRRFALLWTEIQKNEVFREQRTDDCPSFDIGYRNIQYTTKILVIKPS
jgi:phospholipid N-methyltransferase